MIYLIRNISPYIDSLGKNQKRKEDKKKRRRRKRKKRKEIM
jgi:hypothetical protein